MEIEVKTSNLGGAIDWGFAYLKEYSSHPTEEEVLFNPINIFKIVSLIKNDKKSTKNKNCEYEVTTLGLEYITMNENNSY